MKFGNIFKLTFSLLIVIAFVQLIRFGLREKKVADPIRISSKKVSVTNDIQEETTNKSSDMVKTTKIGKTSKRLPDDPSFKNMEKKYQEIGPLLMEEDKRCANRLEQYLPGEDFIDGADKMYKNPDEVIALVQMIGEGILAQRERAREGYRLAESLVNMKEFESSEISVVNHHHSLAKLNTCRDPKILNFFITALEASKKYDWDIGRKKYLAREILAFMADDIADIPTALNLSFIGHLLRSLLDQGFIDGSYREEVEFSINEVMDHQVQVMERIQPGSDRRQNLQELLFDFDARRQAAEKIKELVNKYLRELS